MRTYFEGVRSGLLADLATFPEQLRDPVRDRATVAFLTSLLDELRRGRLIAAAAELRPLLNEHLAAMDETNEYDRVVREHDAFAHLLAQLPER